MLSTQRSLLAAVSLPCASAGNALAQTGFVKGDQILAGTNFIFSTTRQGAFTAEGNAFCHALIHSQLHGCCLMPDVLSSFSPFHVLVQCHQSCVTSWHCKLLESGSSGDCASHTPHMFMLLSSHFHFLPLSSVPNFIVMSKSMRVMRVQLASEPP